MCRLRFAITWVLAPKMGVTGSSSSFAKYLPVRGPCTVTTTHLSFCGAKVMSGSRPSSHQTSIKSGSLDASTRFSRYRYFQTSLTSKENRAKLNNLYPRNLRCPVVPANASSHLRTSIRIADKLSPIICGATHPGVGRDVRHRGSDTGTLVGCADYQVTFNSKRASLIS